MCKTVAIVVPIYKEVLSAFESAAMTQLQRVLGSYQCFYITPESKEFSSLADVDGSKIIKFPDRYFVSTASYSEMMMSEDFYRKFDKFEYILIYQLDAFVFSDRLMEFCQLGYDYIGAPVPFYMSHHNRPVENGGFSLRKVKSVLRILERGKEIVQYHQDREIYLSLEDQFYCFCARQPELNFRLAPFNVAANFSLEFEVGDCYRDFPNRLPFGCHRWSTGMSYKFLPVIRKLGYVLPEVDEEEYRKSVEHGHRIMIYKYILKRMLRPERIDWTRELVIDILWKRQKNKMSYQKNCVLWGFGKVGKEVLSFFHVINIQLAGIYDRNIEAESSFMEMFLRFPKKEEIQERQFYIIITTSSFEKEIISYLNTLGLGESDFCTWDALVEEMSQYYLKNIFLNSTLQHLGGRP